MLRRFRLVWCAVLLSTGLPLGTAQAELWGDVLVGLDYAGFQYNAQRNPLSQGVTVQTFRNFQNTRLDFGTTEMVLTGPVVAQFTTASRGMRNLDFTISFGAEGNPLLYTYESDVGSTAVRVDGSTVFNVDGSINQFGWYDFEFQLSSRQTASSTGRFANLDEEFIDYDIGPINVSGNIFADLLATMTDPFFASTGYENFFASFSGRTARGNALESTVSTLKAKAATGQNLSKREVAELVRMAAEARFHGDDMPSLDFLGQSAVQSVEITTTYAPNIVPEPSSLLLLLVPAVAWLGRRPR